MITNNKIKKGQVVQPDISDVNGLQLALDGKTNEAPIDGLTYSRKDGNWQSVISSTGLERLTEGANTGWRLISRNPLNFGDIGPGAVDFSDSSGASSTRGASGNYSATFGLDVTASGWGSFAVGFDNVSSGTTSFTGGITNTNAGYSTMVWGTFNTGSAGSAYNVAFGLRNVVSNFSTHAIGAGLSVGSLGTVAVGQCNDIIAGGGANGATTPMFIVGNGDFNYNTGVLDVTNRSNALVVYKSGSILAPTLTSTLISAGSNRSLVTREYLESVTSTLPTQDQKDAMDNASSPSASNPFITSNQVIGGLPTGETPTGYSSSAPDFSVDGVATWKDVPNTTASVTLASSVPIFITSSWVADKTATGGSTVLKFRIVNTSLTFSSQEINQFIKSNDEPTAGSIKTRTSALPIGSHTFKLQVQHVSGGVNGVVRTAQFFAQAQQSPKGDTGFGVASGGLTNQLLFKATDNDYDTIWRNTEISDVANLQTTLNGKIGNATGTPNTMSGIWTGTQAQYTALGTYDAAVIYNII
jgi:hypothetical protein